MKKTKSFTKLWKHCAGRKASVKSIKKYNQRIPTANRNAREREGKKRQIEANNKEKGKHQIYDLKKTEDGDWNEGKRTGKTTKVWHRMDNNLRWITKNKSARWRSSAVGKDEYWKVENGNWKKTGKRINWNVFG